MKKPILVLKNITKYFSEDFTLTNINLDLFPGEVHILIGENGSGKSTIMKIIGGILKPDRGTIFINNVATTFDSEYDAKKHGILYIMQDTNLYYNLTTAENIFYDKLYLMKDNFSGINYFKLFNLCEKILHELNISIDAKEEIKHLSFAQKQLIELAKAYVSDAKIIIFDEPSSALTDFEKDILFKVVTILKNKGIAIFYISHKLDDIKKIGDRITVLHHGQIVGTKNTEEASKDTVITMMTGLTFEERYPKLDIKIGEEVLRVENLKYQTTLNSISFNLHKGEIIGITGLVGSGRTQLSKCLFGDAKPTGGSIFIEGKEVFLKEPADAIKAGINLIPENRKENSIFECHNVIDNMTISALNRYNNFLALSDNLLRKTTEEYIRQFSIKPQRPNNLLETYSGGNQQKIIIAKWVMCRSKIYIMDEPTRGVDIASKVDIYNCMNDIVSKGASIIFISSEIEEILGMSDKILVLAGGRIVSEMSKKDATKEKILDYATSE